MKFVRVDAVDRHQPVHRRAVLAKIAARATPPPLPATRQDRSQMNSFIRAWTWSNSRHEAG